MQDILKGGMASGVCGDGVRSANLSTNRQNGTVRKLVTRRTATRRGNGLEQYQVTTCGSQHAWVGLALMHKLSTCSSHGSSAVLCVR